MPDTPYTILSNRLGGVLRVLPLSETWLLEEYTQGGYTHLTLTAAELVALLQTVPPRYLWEALDGQEDAAEAQAHPATPDNPFFALDGAAGPACQAGLSLDECNQVACQGHCPFTEEA